MKTFSGQLGIVLFPDQKTTEKADNISKKFRNNQIFFNGDTQPHISLYHSKLQDVPTDEIKRLFQLIKPLLSGETFTLKEINVFGGKFVFWDVVKDTAKMLFKSHNTTLKNLSIYFLKEGEQQADREKITLSTEETFNVRNFGHPLVGKLWRPHITLAYLKNLKSAEQYTEEMNFSIKSIGFVEIGDYGIIKKLLFKEDI